MIVPHTERMSAGQIQLDAAVFSVPTFGHRFILPETFSPQCSNKLLQRVTQPLFMQWSSENELFEVTQIWPILMIKKLEMLEGNETMYKELVEEVNRRTRKYCDIDSLPSVEQVSSKRCKHFRC